MLKLIKSSISSNRKKYIAVVISVMMAVFFLLATESIYISYCDAKISNAYTYDGKWDFKSDKNIDENELPKELSLYCKTENYYSAKLDKIKEEDRIEGYAEGLDNYLLSIVGVDEKGYKTIPEQLTDGRYPKNNSELLVPEKFVYNGKYIQIGDEVTFELIERMDVYGNIIQKKDISKYDTYNPSGTATYTVCGTYDSSEFTKGNYVFEAYTYKSGNLDGTSFYISSDHTKDGFAELGRQMMDQFGNSVSMNYFVQMTIDSVYNSDYFRVLDNGILIIEIVIIMVALSVIVLNLIQVGESERNKIFQFYTLGAKKNTIAGIYIAAFGICELLGMILGIGFTYLSLSIGKKKIVSLLNSRFADFSLIRLDVVKILVILLALISITYLFLRYKIKDILSIKEAKTYSGIKRKACKNLVELSSMNVRKRYLFNIALTLSLAILITVSTLVISIHPGMIAKGEKIAGLYTLNGHFYTITNVDLTQFSEDFAQMEGIDKIYKEAGSNILDISGTVEDRDLGKTASELYTLIEEHYDRYRAVNPNMVDYETFVKEEKCYVHDAYRDKDGNILKASKYQKGDIIEYRYWNDDDKIYTVKVDGFITDPDFQIPDFKYCGLVVPIEKIQKEKSDTEFFYRFVAKPGYVKKLGEQLNELALENGFFIVDTAKIYYMAEDNHSLQVFALTTVSVLFIMIGIAGMITAIRLDRISRIREFHMYKTLGMDNSIRRKMQFFEYMSVWTTALIITTIVILTGTYAALSGLMEYYAVSTRTFIINMIKVAGIALAALGGFAMIVEKKEIDVNDRVE